MERARDNSVKGEVEERNSQIKSLFEAAIEGNANDLHELLQKCPFILDQVTCDCVAKDNHPLHIGAQFGHVELVREILNRKSELTREINSKGLSPLHVASEKGHVEVVKLLLEIDANVCFLRDVDGRTPLHLAAMRGRVEVLKELVGAQKMAAWILTEERQPILHFCAEHGQFEALIKLVDFVHEDVRDDKFVKFVNFVNLKDSDDNTILHFLTAMEETHEVIKYLINKKPGLDVNSKNVHGFTAMDVLEESRHGKSTKKIRKLLKKAKAKLAWEISETPWSYKRSETLPPKSNKSQRNDIGEGLMVVAILIVTITFQAMANPPGGFWQGDDSKNHTAGTSIMALVFPKEYETFQTFNTIGFGASLFLIALLVSRYSLKEKASVRALTVATWIAILSLVVTYVMVINTTSNVASSSNKKKEEASAPSPSPSNTDPSLSSSNTADYPRTTITIVSLLSTIIGPLLLLYFVFVFIGPVRRFLKYTKKRIYKLCFKVRNHTRSDSRNTGGEVP